MNSDRNYRQTNVRKILDTTVESFNGRFRDGCLNQQWFRDLADARCIIEDWRVHYNMTRPHSSLGYVPPAVFESKVA